jgi:hypothetical protein
MAGNGDLVGGVGGYTQDDYPSDYNFHSELTLYSNGSTPLERDPYLPIGNEEMGRGWKASNFESIDGEQVYQYDNIYKLSDPMRRNDYYLGSTGRQTSIAPTSMPEHFSSRSAPEHFASTPQVEQNPMTLDRPLMTNVPTFHSRDPFSTAPHENWQSYYANLSRSNNQLYLIFFVMLAMFVIVSCVQNAQINKLQRMLYRRQVIITAPVKT